MVAVHGTGKEITELGGQGVQPGEWAVVGGDAADDTVRAGGEGGVADQGRLALQWGFPLKAGAPGVPGWWVRNTEV